jgi:hypothetical protein
MLSTSLQEKSHDSEKSSHLHDYLCRFCVCRSGYHPQTRKKGTNSILCFAVSDHGRGGFVVRVVHVSFHPIKGHFSKCPQPSSLFYTCLSFPANPKKSGCADMAEK